MDIAERLLQMAGLVHDPLDCQSGAGRYWNGMGRGQPGVGSHQGGQGGLAWHRQHGRAAKLHGKLYRVVGLGGRGGRRARSARHVYQSEPLSSGSQVWQPPGICHLILASDHDLQNSPQLLTSTPQYYGWTVIAEGDD